MMILLLFSFCFLFYFLKNGIDVFLLLAGSCFIFFYPLIFFNELHLAIDYKYIWQVNTSARLIVVTGILFLLGSGLILKKPALAISASHDAYDDFYIRSITLILFLLMGAVVLKHGFGLQGKPKAEVMQHLGYFYKLFFIVSYFVIALAVILKRKSLYLISFLAILLDVSFGFRSSIGIMLIMIFLSQDEYSRKKTLLLFSLTPVMLAAIILTKESLYFTKSLTKVFAALVYKYHHFGTELLMLVNPESSTASLVFNQVVAKHFSIPISYLLNSFFSLIPFVKKLGVEPVAFATYYKGALFGTEGESFASGMLSVSYALGAYFGVALAFITLALFGCLYYKIERIKSPNALLYKATSRVFLSIIILSFFRSDLIYLIGILRTVLIISMSLYVLRRLADRFITGQPTNFETLEYSKLEAMD